MRPSRGVLLGAITGLVAATVAACGEVPDGAQACYPGDYRAADGGDGRTVFGGVRAYDQCLADGGAYAPYTGHVDPLAPCDPAAGGKLAFMCVGCKADDDCDVGLSCVSFPNKGGGHCSRRCSGANECPAPMSGGCGNNGYCKPS